MEKLRLKRNGSFSIRDGWFEKAINVIDETNTSVFSKERGVGLLGIGANMVTSLRYWLFACNVIDAKSELTDFGNLIIKFDRYLDTEFVWWLIHYYLISNYKEAPVFNIFYNYFNAKMFTKDSLKKFFIQYMEDNDIDTSNVSQLESDLSVLIRTYLSVKVTNPEENLNSPLGTLNLISRKDKDKFIVNTPSYSSLSYLVIYKSLIDCLDQSQLIDGVNIDDLMNFYNSPYKLFNLDKNLFYSYLNDMKERGLIILNRTAGLNMLYVKRRLSLNEIFEDYFREAA